MTLPWLPDGYHMRALQLIDRAPVFIPPSSTPRPCGKKWCTAFADKKSGWPVDGPRRVTVDGIIGNIYDDRCTVHRENPDYKPSARRINLGRMWARVDRPTRRKKAA